MQSLVKLDVAGNGVSSVAPLRPLAQLRTLTATQNRIASLAGLEVRGAHNYGACCGLRLCCGAVKAAHCV